MPDTHLYLLGGSQPYAAYAPDFVEQAGGKNARIAALTQSIAGWEAYKAGITQPWLERGVVQIEVIAPVADGVLDLASAERILTNATGVFICGGHTPAYQQLYATEPIRSLICEQFSRGVPVAGVSAGALISMEKCVFTERDLDRDAIEIREGLALQTGLMIGVHYTVEDEAALRRKLDLTGISQGIGIPDDGCVYCRSGEVVGDLGTESEYLEI